MREWIDVFLMGLVLLNLLLLSSSRISACIRIVAFQGILVGALPLVVHGDSWPIRLILFSAVTMLLKGFIFPQLLYRALREANVKREVEPLVGYAGSMIIGILSLIISFWVSLKLPMPKEGLSSWVVPVSFSTIFTGLFVIVSRVKALTQVLGYLVMENGIYVFGVALLLEQPVIVELAILLDVFVAVFVMGIAIFHISREFDHMDTQQLSELKDTQMTQPKGNL